MKWLYFLVLQCFILIIIGCLIYQHKDHAIIVKIPPKTLSQWYQPENKRQVWLHNMFKLRREMQAIEFYAHSQDSIPLRKWVKQFSEHYLYISEMVPSWDKKLDKSALEALQSNAEQQHFQVISQTLSELQQSCDNCHQDFQAITALTYRAPDFSSISVPSNNVTEMSFTEQMQTLSNQINQIKIATEDGMTEFALTVLTELKSNMHYLGKTCINCHKNNEQQYPNESMMQTMNSLEKNLTEGTIKEQGRDLGTLAVNACASCHGTHKLAFGAKQLLSTPVDMMKLLKH